MLILINDPDKTGKRQVNVIENGEEIFSATVADVGEAHKVIKAARKAGWVKPEELDAKSKGK